LRYCLLNVSVKHLSIISDPTHQLLSYTDDVDLNERLAEWENFYHYFRPHRSLKGKPPYEVLRDKLQLNV
jgi:transposase InsO family protein